jgi:hypothetical protein
MTGYGTLSLGGSLAAAKAKPRHECPAHLLCRHLIGNHRPTSLSAPPAPHPPFEIEHLGLRAEPEAEEERRREQRDMMTGGAIDLHEVALPEILDPHGV